MPVEVHTDETTGYRVSLDQLEAALTPRTKLLVFVSPSNPTGAVYSPAEVEAIGRWAVEKGIWVVTDEIYEHLVYGDARFASMPTLVPELADRCVVVNGVAKTYAMTGWRVGWLRPWVAPCAPSTPPVADSPWSSGCRWPSPPRPSSRPALASRPSPTHGSGHDQRARRRR